MVVLEYPDLINLTEDFDYSTITEIIVEDYSLRDLQELKLSRFINVKKFS